MSFDFFFIERAWEYMRWVICGLILLFLFAPTFAIIPLSFNAEPYFTFPMPGLSTQWYEKLVASEAWRDALGTSLIVATSTTIFATLLGTLAALGLTLTDFRMKAVVMGLLISPMMVPTIITGVGMFFLYAWLGVLYTIPGLVMAHTVLALPFVVLIVTATLANFNVNLMRAGASLGANPIAVFFKIVLPVILPGVLGGAVLAFVTSFDELIIALMVSGTDIETIPRQMWSGVREEISPVITAAATVLISFSILLMGTAEFLRRRTVRLRSAKFAADA